MNSRRVAIVAGCRTPFSRSGTVYRDLTVLDLAKACLRELMERTELNPACASSNQAIADLTTSIRLGHAGAGIAAGADHERAGQRDETAKRGARPGLGLRPGRNGLCNGPGAMTSTAQGAFTSFDEQGVAVLTLELPGEKVNTLGAGMIGEFEPLLEDIHDDKSVKAVVIRSGKADNVIAGADIKEFTQIGSAEEGEALSRAGQAIFDKLEGSSVPVVAAIHGTCVGGGTELSLACRYRVAADDRKTSIGLPEVMLGLIPGAGGEGRSFHAA